RENAQLRDKVSTLEKRLDEIGLDQVVFDRIVHEPPAIDALVLSVDGKLRLVVLDKGKRDEVKPGYVFSVYRGSTFKGQVKIQDVKETTSCGLIVNVRSEIVAGDSATTQL